MQRILRLKSCLVALALPALVLTACGGDEGGGKKASAKTDVKTLIDQTFTGDKKVDSGKLALLIKLNVQGGGSGLNGPIKVTLGGPFQSQGSTKLPKFDLDLTFEGAGQNIKAGVTSTGDKGFVSFNGQEYAVSDQIFQQFKKGFEQAAAQGNKSKGSNNPSLKSLGIDPRRWLTNPKNAGEAKVGDDDTIKITGGVDIAKLLEDVNTALSKAGSLGLQGQAQLPTKLTDTQKRQVTKAVQDLSVEIYTGKDDSTLRRMAIKLTLKDPEGSAGQADVDFDLSITDLNKEQEVTAPENAKPFDELLGSLGALGLGNLGGLGGGGGGGSGSSGSGSSGSGGSADALKKYTDCIEAAGSDLEKAQQCASLLTP